MSLGVILGGLQLYHDAREEIMANKKSIDKTERLYLTVTDWMNGERDQDQKTDEKIMALKQEIEKIKASKTVVFGGGESKIGSWEYGDGGIAIGEVSTNADGKTVNITLLPNAAYTIGTPTNAERLSGPIRAPRRIPY